MSKYEPLSRFLASATGGQIRMGFQEIEKMLGFELPPSARKHRPWWSNNGSNSAMTQAWLDAGFQTEQVDMAAETLVFRRRESSNPSGGAPVSAPPAKATLFGGLRGTVRISADLTLPTGELWNAEAGRL